MSACISKHGGRHGPGYWPCIHVVRRACVRAYFEASLGHDAECKAQIP